jgi:hypothetical protein
MLYFFDDLVGRETLALDYSSGRRHTDTASPEHDRGECIFPRLQGYAKIDASVHLGC